MMGLFSLSLSAVCLSVDEINYGYEKKKKKSAVFLLLIVHTLYIIIPY